MKRVRVAVRGRVQGVGFRDFTWRQAQRLGLRGWVRNCADGSVEAHVEGDASAVDALLECLEDGPPLAAVTALELREDAPERGLDAFEIR